MKDNQSAIPNQNTQELIQLTHQRQQLSDKVDQWNSGMVFSLVLTLLAAAAVLVTTRMVIVRSKQLAGVQDRLENANDKQATANRLQLEHDLSVQQERTAKAETALLHLQQQLKGREVTPKQMAALKAIAVGRAKGIVTIQKLDGDPEAVEYARQLFNTLKAAGWTPEYSPGILIGGMPVGFNLSVYSQEPQETDSDGNLMSPSSSVFYGQTLRNSLKAVGITVNKYQVQTGPPIPRDSVYLAVGHKP